MTTHKKKILITGAAGYIASQILPTFREKYDLVLRDISTKDRQGNIVEGVEIADFIDEDRTKYSHLFEGLDGIIHLGHKARNGNPLDHYFSERENVQMVYNILRTAYDNGVPRVVIASSNHAADFYEHFLIHERKMEMLETNRIPLSDNFYGWAKATYEHLGFLFSCGGEWGFRDSSGREKHTSLSSSGNKHLETVFVRIGAPRPLKIENYLPDLDLFKRDLGAYISPRDITQLLMKSIEAKNIENEYGIPWQVVYGISNNTRAFWSLSNAREKLGYAPEDDSEVKFREDVKKYLLTPDAPKGRVNSN